MLCLEFRWTDARMFWASGSMKPKAQFLLLVMNDLKDRGIKGVCVFCVDGLTGFREAINAAFPMPQIQALSIRYVPQSAM